MIENNKLPHQPELSGLNASLSALKNIQEVFKALVRITPYPITMWSPDGKLLYANSKAIDFFGDIDQLIDYCIWDDTAINEMKSVIDSSTQTAQVIPLPTSSSILFQSKNFDKEKLKGIESIVCPIRNKENNIEIILLYLIDNSYKIQLRAKNRQLRDEKMNLAITINTISNLMRESEIYTKENTLAETKDNLSIYLDNPLVKDLLSPGDIKQLGERITNICTKYQSKSIKNKTDFTLREKEICEMLLAGLLGKEIAESLNVSYSTIHTHIKNIRKKLNITGTKTNLKTYLLKYYG